MAVKRLFNCRVVFFLIILLSSLNLFAAVVDPILQDNAELFSEEEEMQLYKVMEPITRYGGVAFVTNKDAHSDLAADVARSYCERFFDGKSGVVFLLDMHKRRIEFYSTGEIYDVMGEAWSDIIADNVYEYATNGQYFDCAQKAFTQINTILEGGTVAAPMRMVSSVLFGTAWTFMFLYFFLYRTRQRKFFGERVSLLKSEDGAPDENLKVIVREKKRAQEFTYDNTASKGHGGYHSSYRSSSSSSSYSGGSSSRSSGGGGGHGF